MFGVLPVSGIFTYLIELDEVWKLSVWSTGEAYNNLDNCIAVIPRYAA